MARFGVATLKNNRLVQNNFNVHVRPARTKYAWLQKLRTVLKTKFALCCPSRTHKSEMYFGLKAAQKENRIIIKLNLV